MDKCVFLGSTNQRAEKGVSVFGLPLRMWWQKPFVENRHWN
jgi:hypothetical protein